MGLLVVNQRIHLFGVFRVLTRKKVDEEIETQSDALGSRKRIYKLFISHPLFGADMENACNNHNNCDW